MTTNWTVGVDGSPDGCSALAWAAAFAAESGGTVTPLTAWHVPLTIRLVAGRRPVDVDRNGLRAEAELLAAETVDGIDAPRDVLADPDVVEGHPAPVLLERSIGGSTVVVGRRGVSDFKHRLLGSVSNDLATHAHGPVVVVPASWRARPCRKIAVGFDGSESAAAALRWTLEVAPPGAVVEALIAVDVIPWLRPELVEERYPGELEAAKHRILHAADAVDPERRAVRVTVLHGPRQALAEACADADLVVVGPRGIGGAARAILGSVTTWLLHNAACPVAVVPTPN